MRFQRAIFAVLLALPLLVAADRPAMADTVVATGFADEFVANVPAPTDITFTPDGRMLVTQQQGRLRIVRGSTLEPTPALDISAKTCALREQGLVGVAVDPNFTTNHFVYLYYTFNKAGECHTYDDGMIVATKYAVNRLSRFVLPAASDVIDPASETVLLDNIPAFGIHNSGDLNFGADGLLYVSVGDGGCKLSAPTICGGMNDNARFANNLFGKILRINTDGTPAAGNPNAGKAGVRRCGDPAGIPPGTGPCGETFASGLRNPFRFAMKPGTNEFFINDVGDIKWEEVNRGQKGADYGWNVREGPCTHNSYTDCGPQPSGMTNPMFTYRHDTGCSSITGAAFVPEGVWPAPYSGAYLFADYVCGKIFLLAPKTGGGYQMVDVVSGLGFSSAVSMTFGPFAGSQALFYTNYKQGGEIRRLSFGDPAARTLTASFNASPAQVPAGGEVTFDAGGSFDPEGGPLAYHWDFGDTQTAETTSPVTTHTYGNERIYTPALWVVDQDGNTSPTTNRVVTVGGPPTPVITGPSSSGRYNAGQALTLTGQATDNLDGAIPDSGLKWEVLLHHDLHTHPYLGPVTGNNIPLVYPQPEDLAAAATSYLEVRLTATDSTGLQRTVTQDLLPRKVTVTLATNRSSSLKLQANTATFNATASFTAWAGQNVTISAPSKQKKSNKTYTFQSWSDRGARTHVVRLPSTDTTYTASYKKK